MKKLILLSASLITLSASVNAQEVIKKQKQDKTANLTLEQRAQKHVDAISNEVSVTADQKTKIYGFALTKVKKVDEIRAKYKSAENKEGLQAELDANKKEFRKSVKSILTPEQLETLKAKHKEMKAAGKPNALDQE